MSIKFLRLPSILSARGCGKSKHYADIRDGLFVPSVALGARAQGTAQHELEAINSARLAGKSDDEIRALVRQLIDQRKVVA